MLSIRNLSKNYGQQMVLPGLSIEFADSRTCIVGANGSGKTTLLFILAGLLKSDSGNVLWQEKILANSKVMTSMTAIASDGISIPGFLTVKKLLLLTESLWQVKIPEKLVLEFGLDAHFNKKVNQLSAGNLKKTQLVNAFMRNPEVLLLDEPNTSLDEHSCEVLWRAMREYPGSIIAASNEPALFTQAGFAIQDLTDDH